MADLRDRQRQLLAQRRELRDWGRTVGVRFTFGEADRVELNGRYLAHIDTEALHGLTRNLPALDAATSPEVIRAVVGAYEEGRAQGEHDVGSTFGPAYELHPPPVEVVNSEAVAILLDALGRIENGEDPAEDIRDALGALGEPT